MTAFDDKTFFVLPLSVQKEDDAFLVGNQELEEFYQFPQEGLRVIRLLQEGRTVAEIKQICRREFAEEMDVDDFVQLLLDAGFIFASQQEAEAYLLQKRNTGQDVDKRLTFSANPTLAAWLFSPLSLLVWLGVVGLALVAAWQDPQLRINPGAFYIQKDFTLFLLTLLVLNSLTTGLHELGHMLATARHGLDSRLGLGNRLWNIVAEADLSGLWALPKEKRYLPMLAGMLVDIFSIACITLLLRYFLQHEGSPFWIQILQALILQILITISWQFNLFLKTDIYFVLCNYCSYPNLDTEARLYLRDCLHRLSFGLVGTRALPGSFYKPGILRVFTLIWVLGRIASLALLFLVILPTLWRYAKDAWHAVQHGSSSYDKLDLSLFVLISVAVLGAGMYLWLRGRFHFGKGN